MIPTSSQPAELPAVQHAVIGLHSEEAIHVTITEQSSDRWHRCLNALWDDGIVATLSDRAFRVLGALLRLRTDDGTAHADLPALCRLTGYAERSVRYGLTELLKHPRRLLAAKGRDLFEILPGWSFAGRRPESAPSLLQNRAGLGTNVPASLHRRAENCTTVQCPPPVSRERTRGASELRSASDDDGAQTGFAAVVEILLGAGIGFDERDARRLAKAAGDNVRLVRNAIARAEEYRKTSRLRTGPGKDASACMRAIVATAIREQWALFDRVGNDEYRQEVRKKARLREIDLLRRRMERVMSSAEFRAFEDWGWENAFDTERRVLTEQWANWGDQSIRARLMSIAIQTPSDEF